MPTLAYSQCPLHNYHLHRPNHTLLRSQTLHANMQEAHHACSAVKIQMVGSRWVMNAMLFPLKCTWLCCTDQVSSVSEDLDNPATCGLVGDGLLIKWSSCNMEAKEEEFFHSWNKTSQQAEESEKFSLHTQKSSGKLVAAQTCLHACMVYSGVCCQGVYHLSPSLSKSRGVINSAGNTNSVHHSDLLSAQHRTSMAGPGCVGLWIKRKKALIPVRK